MRTERMHVRLPLDVKAWLSVRSQEENTSMNDTVLAAVRNAMQADPLAIYVTECMTDELGTFYTVSVGRYGDDFYDGPSKDEAITAARAKARELGLPRSSIRFEIEDFNDLTAAIFDDLTDGQWSYKLRVVRNGTAELTKVIPCAPEDRKATYAELFAQAQEITKNGGRILPVLIYPLENA